MNHTTFATALLNPSAPTPAGLHVCNGSDPAVRFAVYKNNVIVSLIDALAYSFPVTHMLVGEPFFRAMAREFVYQCPPRSPVLAYYGADFAAFIEHFPPAASLPYLADMARLEYICMQSCHAADAATLDPVHLAQALTQPQSLALLRMQLAPSTMLLQSRYAVARIWAAHQVTPVSSVANPFEPECMVVVRPHLAVKVLPIDAATYAFIQAIHNDVPLGEAATQAMQSQSDFDLASALALLIREHVMCSLTH